MNYTSTRDSALCTGASTAILTGIAPGGGLFVPQSFPQVKPEDFYGLTYPQTAQKVLGLFLESVREYGRDPWVLVKGLMISLLFQFLVIVAIFCVGTSLKLGIPFFSYCVFVPLVCLLESVPSTINGMGFSDAGYIMFFSAVGLADPTAAAPAMALLYMMLTLIYASCGGLLFLRRLAN